MSVLSVNLFGLPPVVIVSYLYTSRVVLDKLLNKLNFKKVVGLIS